jgi:predicted kinase
MKLLIVRGISGSGKSTYAKSLHPDYIHLEADQFFYVGEKYCFDPSKLAAAHRWCYQQVTYYLQKGYDVVVSNTFCRKWEYQQYLDLKNVSPALEISIHVCTGNYKSLHAPDKVVERQRKNWED